MIDELRDAIQALQGHDNANVQRAFASIADMTRQEPGECAAELSRAVLAERATGALRTPRLLTLLGLTRAPVPECVPICIDQLRALTAADTSLPADAALGAAAIVARTLPRALLPDIGSMQADPQAAQAADHEIARALLPLLSITSQWLRQAPDSAVADMARWLWCDCAVLDLMTLADFAGALVEKSGADDPIVGLMADLVERVSATADQKRYSGQRLQEAGVSAAMAEQLKTAWCSIRVTPAADPVTLGPPPADPEPPPPEPRVDEWLAAFSEGDHDMIELARAAIDELFEEMHPPAALAWWVAVTADALPLWRRRRDIHWALLRLATTVRRHGETTSVVPPSVLRRWLDTPQLLDPSGSQIALDLLARQQPGVVVQRYLHRAVAASSGPAADILMEGMWRALAAAEPSAVLQVASRWIAFDFGESAFLKLLLNVLIERVHAQPALADALASELTPAGGMPADVIDAARELLDNLRGPPPEDILQP